MMVHITIEGCKTVPKTVDQVVDEILDDMSEKKKVTVKYTKEADLIQYLHNWGKHIRNRYNLWHNPEMLEATGKDHADDASMVIMQKVWQKLQETELEVDAECPKARYHPKDWPTPHTPVCHICGLPFYKHEVSGDWVHPQYIN